MLKPSLVYDSQSRFILGSKTRVARPSGHRNCRKTISTNERTQKGSPRRYTSRDIIVTTNVLECEVLQRCGTRLGCMIQRQLEGWAVAQYSTRARTHRNRMHVLGSHLKKADRLGLKRFTLFQLFCPTSPSSCPMTW